MQFGQRPVPSKNYPTINMRNYLIQGERDYIDQIRGYRKLLNAIWSNSYQGSL